MTRVYVDLSLLTPSSSAGVISGYLDLAHVPSEGDTVAFDKPICPVRPLGIVGFPSSLVVEHVLPPVAGTTEVLLSLADVILASQADALEVAEYLQQGFGLYFDEH